MSQNINNIPQYTPMYLHGKNAEQQPNFSANTTQVSSKAAVVDSNPILSRAEKAQEGDENLWVLPAGTLGFGAGLIALTNFMNKSLQEKEYDKTFYHKVETAVDKFGQKPKVSQFIEYLRNKKHSLSLTLNKSEIWRTLINKHSKGGSMVESQAAGSRGHLATRAIEVIKKYKEANPTYTGFDEILKKAGDKNTHEYYDEIIKAIEKSNIVDKTKVFSNKPWWGLGIINNKASLQEILNKAKLIENYKASGKTIGQKAAGYLLRGTECLTNGMFSGKGAIIFQAFFIAQSLQEAMKAEKGEKVSTFAGSFAELMAMMATMGIQMRIVNSIAGLKNMGMTQDSHKAYQAAMDAVNKAAKAGNKAEYEAQKAIIENIKNTAKKNLKWYQKPIKWIGDLCAYGRLNETIKPLKSKSIGSIFKNIGYGTKVSVGYVGRVALIMAAIMPLFSKTAKGIAYSIFGKPVKTIEKEKAAESGEEENTQQVQEQNINNQQIVQPQQPQSQINQTQKANQQTVATNKPGNLLDKLQQQYQQPKSNSVIGSQSIAQNTNVSNELKSPEYLAGVRRTYIPNPILGYEAPANPASSRAADIDAIMRQADLAELQAQKFLG